MQETIFALFDNEKLKNLSVKIKIRALVLMSVILAFLVAAIGLYGIIKINGSMVTTYKESVVPLDKLRGAKNAIELDIIELLTNLKEGKLSSSGQQSLDDMYAIAYNRITAAKKTFEKDWQEYKNGNISAEEKGLVEEMEPTVKVAIDSITNAQNAVKSKDFAAVLEYTGSEMPFMLQPLSAKLDALMQMQVLKTISLYDDSQDVFNGVLTLALVLFLVGVLIVYILGKKISDGVLQDIDLLYHNADDIAHYKLDTPFEWTQKDELGKLGRRIEFTRQELNSMINNLKLNAEEIGKAHEAIRHSINYARRIQMSFLPEEAKFLGCDSSIDPLCNVAGRRDLIKDYFVVWNPKDIIGGDCYWFEHTEDGFFIAVIDCTGHGVPGALMTFVVLSTLSRALTHMGTAKDPGALLEFMNKHIKNDLGQHTEDSVSNDGMDGAFIFIDKDGKTLRYAGANIPLIFTRPNAHEFEELRPDKLSAGYVHVPSDATYANQELTLEPGMKFYITTDGIVDQVGGEKSLCFGKKRLKKQLLATLNLTMEEQKEALLKEFYSYRGSEAQRDDNTIIGFQI